MTKYDLYKSITLFLLYVMKALAQIDGFISN